LLREAENFHVLGPAAVVGALAPIRDIVSHYHRWDWTAIGDGIEIDGLRFDVLPVHDKPPRYAPAGPGPWAVAYRITDPVTGGVLVYAPCVRIWPRGFDEFVAGADHVLLDGTFYSADEMTAATGGHRAAAAPRSPVDLHPPEQHQSVA
jgi:pyrroloquinoline quinone biosynthesis protein B